ncbi:MAG: SDR family NAD(P)-dependent oxidoreductase [Pseudomonadota bacterium]
MKRMLEGQVVLVTGAGRGLGRDIALLAGQQGARVMVNDLGASLGGEGADASVAEEVARTIRDAGGEASFSAANVTDRSAVHAMVEQCWDEFGGLSYAVNNAGILRDRMFHRMSDEEWDAVINVHLNGAFNISRACADSFRKQESGCLLHMTSTAGLVGNLGQANYASAKLGIAGLSRSISIDMAKFNVRSNCIAPFAYSRMTASIPKSGAKDNSAHLEKVKRMESGKIAPLAVALGSESAAHVTGQIFAVRANEIFIMSQPRPLRGMHRDDGWSVETVLEHALPALAPHFTPSGETSRDVFCWDPV